MRSSGSPHFDADGKIVCWYGSVEDIDELKQTELALRVAEAKLEALTKIEGVVPFAKNIPAALAKVMHSHGQLAHVTTPHC